MRRRRTLSELVRASWLMLFAACGGAASTPAPGSAAASTAGAPQYDRVVLVTIDTLRADHLGSYGYARQTSPFIDELAGRGVLFENAVTTISHTAPSLGSLLTGLLPSQHGLLENGHELDPSLTTLADLFSEAGYATGAFLSIKFLGLVAGDFERVRAREGEGDAKTWFRADVVVSDALRWLENRSPDEPWFLWVHFFDVHEWADPEPEYAEYRRALREASGDAADFYDTIAELHALPPRAAGEPFERLPWGLRKDITSRQELVDIVEEYDARIMGVDAQIRRLWDAVADHSAGGSSLWAIVGDHGEGLGSHGFRGHGRHIYQEQLRVPFLLCASDDSLAPTRVGGLVSMVDVMPTLALARGTALPEAEPPREGRSLWPLIEGTGDWREIAFAERCPATEFLIERGWSPGGVFALVTERHKYVLHESAEDEFFDLEADPMEQVNLVGTPSADRDRLRGLLEKKLREMSARGARASDEAIAPEILEELRALGYAGPEGGEPDDG